MSRRNLFLTATVLGALALPASVSFGQATDNGGQSNSSTPSNNGGNNGGANNGGGRGNRGNFDPAQFRQRMEDRLKEQLGANDDEWKVIQPKLQKVMEAQRDARGGGFFGGRGGRDRGNQSSQAQSPVQEASSDLRKTLENKDASSSEIEAKLKTLREARDKAKADLATAQKDLRDVLTQRQEAQLVMMGMLD